MAIWRYTEAAPDLTPALDAAGAAELAAAAAAQQAIDAQSSANRTAAELQALIAAQQAEQSGGTSISIPFPGTGPLPASLVQDSQNGMAVRDGSVKVVYPYNTGNERQFAAVTTAELLQDEQSAVITVVGSLYFGHPNSILIGTNAAGTAGFYADFTSESVVMGAFWANGFVDGHLSGVNRDPWDEWPVSMPDSPTLEFRRETSTRFTARVNGNIVATHNGTVGGDIPAAFTGPGWRHVGFGMHAGWGALFSSLARPVSSFNASDIAVPTVRGAGWLWTRTDPALGPSLRGSGWQMLPVSTFDSAPVILRSVAEYTGQGLRCGGVQILKSDWYTMSLLVKLNTVCGSAYTFCGGIYTAPNTVTAPTLLRKGIDTTGSQMYDCGGTFTEFLPAGTVVVPAAYQAGSNRIAAGAGSGATIYFSGHAANQL